MVYSGESVPFYQQDVKPSFSQYLCGGTSGRASTDNNYIAHGTHPVFLKFRFDYSTISWLEQRRTCSKICIS